MKRAFAIFKKQMKDTLKNQTTLLQFILYPIISLLFTELVAKTSADLPDTFFVTLFATMYAGMVPMVNVSSIISEEREKKSLRMLMMSNVKPLEYFAGIGSYILLTCTIGAVAFGLIGGFAGMELVRFVLTLMAGVLSSLLLGSAIGILSKNQMVAHALVMPFAVIAGFLPMVATYNKGVDTVSNFLYTQQINYLISNPSVFNFTFDRFLIVGGNMLIFLLVFVFAYTKGGLME